MGLGSSSPEDMDQLEETKQMVEKLIDSDEIVIFSKTTCPYCNSAKGVSFMFE
jgi:thioredoxin-related protein